MTDHPSNPQVYTPWQVSVSCLIGGPPAATWMIASNFNLFHDQRKKKLTTLYGIIALLALIGLGLAIPKNSSGGVLAAVIAGLAREITKSQQGPQIEAFRMEGGKIASWWNAIGIGLVSLIAVLAVIFMIVLIVS